MVWLSRNSQVIKERRYNGNTGNDLFFWQLGQLLIILSQAGQKKAAKGLEAVQFLADDDWV